MSDHAIAAAAPAAAVLALIIESIEAVGAIADFFDNTGLADSHPVWTGEDPSGRIALTLGHCRAIRAFLVAGPYPPPPHTIGDGAP